MKAPAVGRWPGVLVALAVAALALVAGVVALRVGRGPEPAAPSRAEGGQGGHPGGSVGPVESDGAERTEEGAAGAAVGYAAASQGWLYLSDEQLAGAVAEVAVPEARAALTEQVVARVRSARERLVESSGRVWWFVRPLAWRVDLLAGTEARVSVWTVTVLSATEVAAPQASWATLTMDLVWLDGTWLLEGLRDTPGPTPMTGPDDDPWSAQRFDEALHGFTRLDERSLS